MVVLILMFVVLPSFAVTFNTVALQNNGFVSVPLGPGLNPLLGPTNLSPKSSLDFMTFVGPIGAVVFSSTLDLAGQEFSLAPFKFNCTSRCSVLFGWFVPTSFTVTPGILSVTVNGVVAHYNFQFQTPVPEPTTLTLLGIGLVSIFCRKHFIRL